MKAVKMGLPALSLVILLFLVAYADPSRFLGIIKSANARLIALGLLISVFSIFLRTVRWWCILQDVNVKSLFPVQTLGMALSNFTPGKVAEPVKTVLLKIRSGVDVSISLPSVVWERVMDVIVLLMLSSLALVMLPLQGNLLLFGVFGATIFAGLAMVALAVLYNKRFGMFIFRIVRKLHFLSRISDSFVKTFCEGKFQKRRLVAGFVITLVAWILDGTVIWLALSAVGISITLPLAPGILSLATIIGIVSMLPGGIGGTEAATAVILRAIGIEVSLAITGSVIARFMTFWVNQLLGGVSLVYLSRSAEVADAIKGIVK